MTRRAEWKHVLCALLMALVVLFFCTKSSPGYPINDWADANIYLSIGKGMTQGQVVYRDLYDHKGPLLYALHALCALISFHDFTGVFVMEALLAAAFFDLMQRSFALLGAKKLSWLLTAVLAVLVYTSVSFAEGDSAEEMALPLIAGTLHGVLCFLQSGEARMRKESLMVHGFLAGCVFWIKFTMIGLHAGLLLTLLLRHAVRREWKDMWRAIGWLFAGFALSTLPWVIYFGLSGALGDWLKVYLYDNLFLYGGEAASLVSRVKDMVKSGLAWFTQNLRYAPLIPLGLLLFIRRGWVGAALWLMTAIGALGTFIGGKSYLYYGLVLAPAAIPALAFIGAWAEKHLPSLPKWLITLVCIAVTALSCQSPNVSPGYGVQMGQSRDTAMQYRMAAHIRQVENPTLLNYGFMDAGFFTAAGIVPKVKYFHQTNVPLQEMLDEQIRYIQEGLCDFVVTRGREPLCIHDRYELIAVEDTPAFWYERVYLYRLKELANR